VKFGENRMIRSRVTAYFRFSKWRPSAIFDFEILHVQAECLYCRQTSSVKALENEGDLSGFLWFTD